MTYWLYNFFFTVFFILAAPLLPFLLLLGERFRAGLGQRLGFYPRDVRLGVRGARPIWIHAVSVGEVLSAGHLARHLKQRFPGRKILLSTFTATGNKIARQSVAEADSIVFLPMDHPWIVGRALRLFDPSLLIFLETEFWPNMLRLAYRRGIPTLLLSGRLSPRAFRQYRFFRFFFSRVLNHFSAVGLQNEDSMKRMILLGVDPEKSWITGNLKHAHINGNGAGPREMEDEAVGLLRRDGRQFLVVGSTHRGEEDILLDVFLSLKPRFPKLFMVLAPRHPERFYEVEELLRTKRVEFEKKSQMNGESGNLADVIFLDTLGELSAFYSLADIAFVGGSLVDVGGHNLMEPARFRKPILFGPHMTNCAEIAEELKQRGGGIEVRGEEDLIREISMLLTDRAKAEKMGEAAYGIVEGDRGVVERSMALVSRYLHS